MNQCKQCGANLPEEARFCLNCGTPVPAVEVREQPATPPTPPQPLDFVQPALAGGMVLGVLSSLPITSCLCCLWLLGGGGLASFLLSKQRPAGLTYGDGALAGVMSGVFGAVVGTVISVPMQIISARLFGSQQEQMEQIIRQTGFQGPIPEWMTDLTSPEITVTKIAFTLLGNLIFYSLFAMIGGIIGVAILQKKTRA